MADQGKGEGAACGDRKQRACEGQEDIAGQGP